MMTKAEKLARELIALNEKYSQADFDKASELILSGKLFVQALGAARTARQTARFVKVDHTKHSAGRSALKPKLKISNENPSNFDLTALIKDVEDYDKSIIQAFVARFLSRDLLASGASVRMFCEQLGIYVPVKLPARSNLLKIIIQELVRLSRDDRQALLKNVEHIGRGESSLQQWSNLIVKGENR